MAWLSGWKRRIPITIDPTTISGGLSENLTNFPVLISISDGTGRNSADLTRIFDEVEDNNQKIALTTSNGTTQCPVEIERWSHGDEEAYLWTKVPTIASGTNTQLYLYYNSEQDDNTEYVGDTTSSGAQAVWDGNYVGVWHIAQDPSGGSNSIKDSTSNFNHGTANGTMTSSDLVNAKIGKGLDFDGSDDYIDFGSLLSSLSQGSISIWFNSSTSAAQVLWNSGTWEASGNLMAFIAPTYSRTSMYDGSNQSYVSDTTYHDGEWHNFTTNWNSTTIYLYIDGDFDASDSNCTGFVPTGLTYLGHSPGRTYYFDGIIDEVRISNIIRSEDWIKTTYQSNENNLLTFGDPEYDISAIRYSEVSDITGVTAKIYGEIPSDNHDAYVNIYYDLADGGTEKSAWNNYQELGLKTSGESFNATITDLVPFNTYYYRWYATYSGSEPSEYWSPSYSFYVMVGKVLKGSANNFVGITSEVDSTFYNTKFACVSSGTGAGLNVIENDEVRLFWPDIDTNASDLTSVR